MCVFANLIRNVDLNNAFIMIKNFAGPIIIVSHAFRTNVTKTNQFGQFVFLNKNQTHGL